MSILSFNVYITFFRSSNLFPIEFMFMWLIVTLKGLLLLNSCKDENEITIKQSIGINRRRYWIYWIIPLFKPSSKLLFKLQLLSYVSFKCSLDHKRFRSFCKKFNSGLFLTFLLRCRPFICRCTSLMFTLSIKSTSQCPKSLLKLDKVRAALPFSVRIASLETNTLQVGNVFIMYYFSWSNLSRICLDVFETVSFVPMCSIMCSGFFLIKGKRWCFRLSIVVLLKSQTFTTWLFLDSRFSSIPVNMESSTIKQVPFL